MVVAFGIAGSSPDTQRLGREDHGVLHEPARTRCSNIVGAARVRRRGPPADHVLRGPARALGDRSLIIGAGAASAVLLFPAIVFFTGPAFAANDTSRFRMDPNTYRLINDMGYAFWVGAVMIGAVVVFATSAVPLRRRSPRWFARRGHRRRGDSLLFARVLRPGVRLRALDPRRVGPADARRARRPRHRCRSRPRPGGTRSARDGPGAAQLTSLPPCPNACCSAPARRPVPQRVLDALAQPTIGHLDPPFGAIMDEVAELLRATFRTQNRVAFPVSAHRQRRHADDGRQPRSRPATASSAACTGCSASAWPTRSTARGAEVVRVEAEWGRAIPTERARRGGERAVRGAVRRARRDVDRRRPAARRPRRGLRAARRAAARRLRHVAGRAPARPRRGGRRRRVQRLAEVPELPARPGAVHRQRPRAGARPGPPLVVLRPAGGPRLLAGRAAAAPTTTPRRSTWSTRCARRWRSSQEEGLEARWARHAKAHEALRAALGAARLRAARARRRAAAPAAGRARCPTASTTRRCAARC